jgi:hypothetical protein
LKIEVEIHTATCMVFLCRLPFFINRINIDK